MFVKFVINDWCTKKITGLKLFTNDVTETHKTLTRKLASNFKTNPIKLILSFGKKICDDLSNGLNRIFQYFPDFSMEQKKC